jgi:hypothetical protein
MATSTVSTNIAGNVKPTFASSSAVGLTVRANGEEKIGVLDTAGNMVDAQIPAGTAAPVLSQKRTITITTTNGQATFVVTSGAISSADQGKPITGTGIPANSTILTVTDATHGTLSANATASGSPVATVGDQNTGLIQSQFAGYAYVYAATTRYPFVENDISINGSLAPRSNPSPNAVIQTDGSGTGINLSIPQTTRPDIDEIWIFRTEFFTAQVDAQNNADAGIMFYIGSVPNNPAGSGNVWYGDHNPISTGDQAEVDNFGVPTFQFVVYQDPYWWGWGNLPFISAASWGTNGIVTLTDASKKWFTGRNGQFIRLSGVSAGGADSLGGFFFKWLSATTCQLTTDGTISATLPAAGQGTIVVQGPSSTLYRSKARNPFSWGFTQYLGNNARVPQVYAFKIGGGQGTAIGIIPAINYLYVSTEYPAGSFVLDLKLAGTVNFENSLKILSTYYSVTSHFSLFTATKNFTMIRELPDERTVLWGWDAKNYSIIECDGFKINPVSQKISNTLRNMSQDRSKQLLAHGAYDARNRLNCMWLPTANSGMLCNFLVAQHGPTGEWFMHDEHDVLCSAMFQDAEQSVNKIFVGTQAGFVGEAFAEGYYSNWQNNPYNGGIVSAATANSITRNDGGIFNVLDQGYIGSWCLVTDANGNNEQWARISNITQNSLTFDFIYSKIGGSTAGFNPVPDAGWLFYVGLIEVRALKYFDLTSPASDKKLSEIWLTLEGVDTSTGLPISTFLRFYEELSKVADNPNHDGLTMIKLAQSELLDASASMAWFTRTPPGQRLKIFGLEIIDRGYAQWRMYNYTLKMEP